MGDGFADWMEPTQRNDQVLSIAEYLMEGVAPVVALADDVG